MHRFVRAVVVTTGALFALTGRTEAQGNGLASAQPPLPATDSIFRRARRLVSEGDGVAGRALVDSLLHAAAEGTPAYGDALFWRGALAETAADAERDYRRVIVEYPLSPYADDALLSIAELEQARGDRAAAYQHLQRFVREHSASPARARAGLAAARLAFEQRDTDRGCAMIADARSSASGGDVELRNQIEYYGSRCPAIRASTAPVSPQTAGVTSAAAARATPTTADPTQPTRVSSSPQSEPVTSSPVGKPRVAKSAAKGAVVASLPPSPAREVKKEPADGRGIWTIQLAAYDTRGDAERLVRKLAGRDVKARISGTKKPFRVRLDYYPTRQAAAAEVAALKERGIIGFVTDEPRTSGVASP
jgi:cell division protein FtsN